MLINNSSEQGFTISVQNLSGTTVIPNEILPPRSSINLKEGIAYIQALNNTSCYVIQNPLGSTSGGDINITDSSISNGGTPIYYAVTINNKTDSDISFYGFTEWTPYTGNGAFTQTVNSGNSNQIINSHSSNIIYNTYAYFQPLSFNSFSFTSVVTGKTLSANIPTNKSSNWEITDTGITEVTESDHKNSTLPWWPIILIIILLIVLIIVSAKS